MQFRKNHRIIMKIFFYSFFIFIANMGHAYSSTMSWDTSSDWQIDVCLESDTFQNMSLLYLYENQNWELRIIFNPYYEQIALSNGQSSLFQFYYGVFSKDRIPQSLENHLKEIIDSKLKSVSGGFWSISSTINERLSIDYFANATAVPEIGLAQTTTKNEIFQEARQIYEENTDSNQEICDLFREQTFKKLSLNYEWEGKFYSVHFVYNPMKEALFCEKLSKPVRWPFGMTIADSTYPLSLANYIKSLVPHELLTDSDSIIDVANGVSYFRKNPVSLYTTLQPFTLLNKIENPDMDAEIVTFFTSNQLAKKFISYELDGNFYRVFLINNLEKLPIKSTFSFDTWENGHVSYTGTWNSKIGIFVDKEAPKELIDHISQLYDLSWWDGYWNLSIHNGDKIVISCFRESWQYKYTPCSWYTFMLNAKL